MSKTHCLFSIQGVTNLGSDGSERNSQGEQFYHSQTGRSDRTVQNEHRRTGMRTETHTNEEI